MRRLTTLACLAATIFVSGCASMSEEECRRANWFQQGARDALGGYSRELLHEHRKACAKAGVIPDELQYMIGYERGVRQFCTPENGLQWGLSGNRYLNTCPAELDQAFRSRYQLGKDVFDAENHLRQLLNRQRDKEQQLEKSKDDKQRKYLRRELEDLDMDLSKARRNLGIAERRLRSLY